MAAWRKKEGARITPSDLNAKPKYQIVNWRPSRLGPQSYDVPCKCVPNVLLRVGFSLDTCPFGLRTKSS